MLNLAKLHGKLFYKCIYRDILNIYVYVSSQGLNKISWVSEIERDNLILGILRFEIHVPDRNMT